VDNRGLLLQLDGRFDGSMKLAGQTTGENGGRTHHRLTFTPRPDGGLRQVWESSTDGTTWSVVFDGTYVRKRGTPAS
jgi:hypothetical protein